MGPLDSFVHLLGFAAPAFFVALGLAAAARLLRLDRAARRPWWAAAALNFVAGLVVLGVGLWWFGRDGKMATYAALVLATGFTQWLAGRGWAR